jgi:hypothetical protein
MDKNEPSLVEQQHREAVQIRGEQKDKERALVEAMFREARERQRQEEERGRALVESTHRAAVQQRQDLAPPDELPTIHYTKLIEAKRDSPLYHEWEVYRQQAARLLAEGNAGRHVLIKGAQIIGIWDTHDEAAAGYQRFLRQPFLVHQIQENERVLRCVTERLCRNLPSPSHPAN